MSSTTRSNKRRHQEAELEQELFECVERGDFGRTRELIEVCRVSIECREDDEYYRTPMMCAIENGHVQIARYLIVEKRANVNATDRDGETALVYAVYRRHVEAARLLLEHGADIHIKFRSFIDGAAFSLLGWAIDQKDVNMVALLLRFDADTTQTLARNRSFSALCHACLLSTDEIVRLLLDHNGVDVNAYTPKQGNNCPPMSPLCIACGSNNLELVQLLIQRGAHVVYTTGAYYPDVPCPLKHAVEEGTLDLVRFVLDSSPSLSSSRPWCDDEDRHLLLSVPLASALEHGKLEAAQLLVDRGANVNDWSHWYKCAQKVWNIQAACFLLRAGANVNLSYPTTRKTPLWDAVSNGNVELVKELLKAGADVSIRNIGGETPLGVAYRQKRKDIVYLLLRTSPHVWPRLATACLN